MKKLSKTEKLLLGAGAIAAFAAPFVFMAPSTVKETDKRKFFHRNFAHRGLHTEDKKVPENSLRAFELAAEAGYGIELDVQLSKDGQVVVFHDDTLDRVCNVHGRVDAFTYEELRNMHLCGSRTETVPLFTEVLSVVHGRGPLVVELKNGPRNKELCEKTYEILKSYRGEYCIESFNPLIVFWFRVHAPEVVRGQLACHYGDYGKEQPKVVNLALSRCLLNPLARPHFIAYKYGRRPLSVHLFRMLGGLLFAWTPHNRIEEYHNDAVIFEFYRPDRTY